MCAATLALLVGIPDAAAAPSACAKLWFRAAGEAAKAQAACHAKAAGAGTAVDPTCLATAAEKLARKWMKATLKSDCPTAADAAASQNRVDAFLASLVDLLTPPASHCCATATSCYAGPVIDSGGCLELLGTLGPPGSVCDGETGTCVTPPGSGGACCALPLLSVCTAGPSVDPGDCVAAGGSSVLDAVCLENAVCVPD
jgi:hypothetical protein